MTSTMIRLVAVIFVVGATVAGQAQQPQIGVPVPPLGAGPFVFDTAEQHKIRVSVVARGLSHPWSIAFLPDGAMLIPERSGQLRIVRNRLRQGSGGQDGFGSTRSRSLACPG